MLGTLFIESGSDGPVYVLKALANVAQEKVPGK